VRRTIAAALARFAIVLVGRLPFPLAGWLGARFGGLGYWFNRREKRRAIEHLALAFPEQTAAWHRRTALRSFRSLGRCAAEFVCSLRWSPEARLRRFCLNADEFIATINADATEGRGTMCITAHCASWDLIGSFAAAVRPTVVIARRPNDPRLSGLADRLRERAGVEVVFQDESPRPLLRRLRDHGVVGILADQDVRRVAGTFVPFFGREAYTPTAPILLAQAAGATVRMIIAAREKGGYRAVIGERIPVPPKSEGDAGIRRATLAWTQFLEAEIRKRPEQWVWMHRRWKTRPEDVAGE
jgi:KDO2-lipid IV(A) lauroyltransferase